MSCFPASLQSDLRCFTFASAGHHGSDLPVCRGRLQADQLLQLQLLVLCRSVHFGAAVSALEAAGQKEAAEGEKQKPETRLSRAQS